MKQYARKTASIWAFLSGLLIAMGTMVSYHAAGLYRSIGILAIILDYRRGRFPLRGAVGYASGYALGLVPLRCLDIDRSAGTRRLSRRIFEPCRGQPHCGQDSSPRAHRYSDLLGFNMLHGTGLESIPVRLPIPLIFWRQLSPSGNCAGNGSTWKFYY